MSAQREVGHVLVVEDDPPTAQLIATVLEDVDASISTHIVQDGSECLAVLRGETGDSDLPDLVLLDLDLPKVDGLTVLETRTEAPGIRRVPTLVLSNTDDQGMITQCYEEGANAFISKPGDLDEYLDIADRVVDFWFSTARLPDRGS